MTRDLVIQGERVDDAHIDTLARLCRPASRRRLAAGAARLLDVSGDERIAAICAGLELDFAYVPAGARLADIGLVAMDMDSTLISIECVDEIAGLAGVKPEVARITRSAMRGEIAFAESLRRRVALLAGLGEEALARVYEDRLSLSRGALALLDDLKARGIRTLLVSSGFSFFADRLRDSLGLDYAFSNELGIAAGKLTGTIRGRLIDAEGKAEVLRDTRALLGLSPQQVVAIGDGANDLPMMAEAGVSIAFHAKPVVQQAATYRLNHVGLDGVVNLFL